MDRPQVIQELKRDSLGRVELIEDGGVRFVRRVANGGRIPGSGVVARLLMGRERRAFERLAGIAGFPRLVDRADLAQLPSLDGGVPAPEAVLVRTFEEGVPLHRAEKLPLDYFDHLDRLVAAMHVLGVCHNDLHKEQNVVVDRDGFPALIDFQLASVHAAEVDPTRRIAARVRDDLRHVQKHRRRYTRDGRGPQAAGVENGAGYGIERRGLARTWRRFGKPCYEFVTRKLLRTRDGEERRASAGPWPEWTAPKGRREG